MTQSSILDTYQNRMSNVVADPEFKSLEEKYRPYLDLYGIQDIFDVFDVKQAPSGEAITGKLIWHSEYDLPIDLKKDITKIFNNYFVD
ncbi:hypothetical protein AAFN85_00695 [Mucilaginibacter sp. CAU 1740]|uniref:hypothetical protein n=1 Tax=Mucilaginibacter sp. CAU 1740 TaxID=3140365 RepID=UPI00325B7147